MTTDTAARGTNCAAVTVVNLVVASVVMACGMVLPGMLLGWIIAAAIVTLWLTAPLALARRQGTGLDDVRLD